MSTSSFHRKPSEPHTQMRQFNVGDPEIEHASNERTNQPVYTPDAPFPPGYELSQAEREEVQRMRKAPKDSERVGDYARKRIEILANIGRLNKDIEIDGVVFSLRTLKAKEARESTMSIFKCANDADAAYEIRRHILARAIYQIDNTDVEATVGGSDLGLKLNMIDEMEDVVVNKLYTEYNLLRQEVRTKYGLENEEQVKGVVEDIKK